jgi:hypothetical protein
MEISKKTLILIGIIAVVLIISVVYFWPTQKENQPNYTFDPSFEMIDPKNPTTMVNDIINMKKQYDQLATEKCIIEQLQPVIDSKMQFHQTTIVPKKIWTSDGSLTTEAVTYLKQNSTDNIFDFNFEAADNCNQDETLVSYNLTHLFIYKYYSNMRQVYYQSLMSALGSLGLPISYAFTSYRNYGTGDGGGDGIPLTSNSTAKKITIDTSTNYFNRFQDISGRAKSSLESMKTKLAQRFIAIDSLMGKSKADYNKKIEEYTTSRLDIKDRAIRWGIIAFCLTALTLYITGILARGKLRLLGNDPNPNFSTDFKESMWNSVYLITVLLLIITIFILGLASFLGENSLAALLGSIAGYVLNNRLAENKNVAQNSQTK